MATYPSWLDLVVTKHIKRNIIYQLLFDQNESPSLKHYFENVQSCL